MGLYLWGDVPGCCRVPWCHSPPCCHRSCHWPSCRGLRRAGRRLPGTAAAASWWPRLGSGCRGGTGGSRYLDGQRDRRTHGWHRKTWNHRAPVFGAPRGMQKVAPVPSSPVGARACVHGAALRQSHILSAPGLRWPPPARCGHGRVLRAETKATTGSGPGNQQGAKLPVRTPLRAALAAQLPAEQLGGHPVAPPPPRPGRCHPRWARGVPTSCPRSSAEPWRLSPCWLWQSHPWVGHPRATSYPPGGAFRRSSSGINFSSPVFAARPQGGRSLGGTQQHPVPRQPHRAPGSSSDAQEGTRGMGAGCPGPPGCAAAVTQQRAGSSWREARSRWRFRSCGSATCPRARPCPAPGKSPGDAARGALHAASGLENPYGASEVAAGGTLSPLRCHPHAAEQYLSLPGGIGPGERPESFGADGLKAGGRPWLCGELLVLPRAPSPPAGGELL